MAVQNIDAFRQDALAQGYSEQEINDFLGSPEVDLDQQARDAGYSQEEIDTFKAQQGVSTEPALDPTRQDEPTDQLDFGGLEPVGAAAPITDTTVEAAPEQLDQASKVARAEQILSKYNNIYSRHATTGKQIAGLFSAESAQEARQDFNDLQSLLVDRMQNEGYDTFLDERGQLMLRNEDGTVQELDTDLFDDLMNSLGEGAGAIGGAIAGAKGGAALPLSNVHPAAKAATIAGGAILGGAAGAALGSSIDYMRNMWDTKEEFEAAIMFDKMLDAGVADPVYTILGGGAAKAVGSIGKGTMKIVGKAWDKFANGNVSGAKSVLLEDFNISPEQADELVQKWREVGGKDVTTRAALGGERRLSPDEEVIQAVIETQPGGESIANVIEDSNKLVQSINTRAKDIRKAADQVARGASDDIGKALRTNLDEYQTDVKNFFNETKNLASDVIDRTDYRFDLEKMAIEPVMEKIQGRVGDPRKLERFTAVMNKMDGLNQTKTFSDLLELRQTVNDLSSSVKSKDKFSQEGFKKVINTIDKEIKRVSDEYLTPEQSKTFINQFRKAKKEYGQMKRLEDNVLFKQLTKKGATEEQIQRDLNNRILALDDTFVDVMEKLPKKFRDRAEGAVVNSLTKRFTIGDDAGLQAINFPLLNDKLSKINFTDKGSKQFANLVKDMADVFKNDVNLQKVAGKVTIPKFQSYLTTDPVVRAKYEIASGIFNQMKSLAPTKSADRLGLVKVTDRLMQNPLNAKAGEDFIKKMPKESRSQMRSLVDNLRQKWAQAGNKPQETTKLFKPSTGTELKKTSGGFGPGYYLTDRVGNPKVTEQGQRILRQDVKTNELATLADIAKIYGRDVSLQEIRKLKGLPNKLKNKGFKGIIENGKAMLFDKP